MEANASAREDSGFDFAAYRAEVAALNASTRLVGNWFMLVIIPAGIIGNILTLLVALRPQNRVISCFVYIAALAICDTTTLASVGLHLLNRSWYHSLSNDVLDVICKFVLLFSFASPQSGVMIIVAMLVERVIAVSRPFEARMWLKASRAVMVSSALILATFLYNIPVFITSGVTKKGNCKGYRDESDLTTAYTITALFLNAVIPFLAIGIMNVVILTKVKSSKKEVIREEKQAAGSSLDVSTDDMKDTQVSVIANPDLNSLNAPSTQKQHKSDETDDKSVARAVSSVKSGAIHTGNRRQRARENQLTLMTVIMTVVFVVLTMPRYVSNVIGLGDRDPLMPLPTLTIHKWFNNISWCMYMANSACNFFLYAIAGAKFRKDLMAIFCCRAVD